MLCTLRYFGKIAKSHFFNPVFEPIRVGWLFLHFRRMVCIANEAVTHHEHEDDEDRGDDDHREDAEQDERPLAVQVHVLVDHDVPAASESNTITCRAG